MVLSNSTRPHSFLQALGPNSSFSFWPHHMAYGILVLESGVEPRPWTMRAQSSNHWAARGFPKLIFYSLVPIVHSPCPTAAVMPLSMEALPSANPSFENWHSRLFMIGLPLIFLGLMFQLHLQLCFGQSGSIHPSTHPPSIHPSICSSIHLFKHTHPYSSKLTPK